jgi:hypothetical protein
MTSFDKCAKEYACVPVTDDCHRLSGMAMSHEVGLQL